jgi:hypothetical protein
MNSTQYIQKINQFFSRLFFIILIASIFCTIFYLAINVFNIANHELTDKFGNIYGLTISLLLSLLVFIYAILTHDMNISLTSALAIFSGAVADIYWSTYLMITGVNFPIANVADLGFIGVYLLLITVMDLLSTNKPKLNVNAILVILIIIFGILLVVTQSKIYILVCFTVVSSICIFKAVLLLINTTYYWLAAGIILISISDVLIVYLGNLTDGKWIFLPDSIYMLSFCIIAYGISLAKRQIFINLNISSS